MITTVTLNAAIDKTYLMDSFQLGRLSRVKKMYSFAGGKGINAARVIHLLGHPAMATGFIAGNNGKAITQGLDEQGIAYDFVAVEGESRVCTTIIDQSNQQVTELLELGPEIHPDAVLAMKHKVRQYARKSEIIILSGSLPFGAPVNMYAELIVIAKAEGAIVLLDASGEALVEGLKEKPYFIKPNEEEIKAIVSKPAQNEGDLYESIRGIMKSGIDHVVVSLGNKGAIAGYGGEIYKITIPAVKVVNTVGCGDSLTAGMAVAISRKLPIEECLRLAAAVGTANALTVEAGYFQKQDLDDVYPHVGVVIIG